MVTDGRGTPLAVLLTGGNRNDVTQLLPLLDAIPPVRGRVGRPRRRPDSLFADYDYDYDIYRDEVRARGIVPAIVRRGTLHGTGLGSCGWPSGSAARGDAHGTLGTGFLNLGLHWLQGHMRGRSDASARALPPPTGR